MDKMKNIWIVCAEDKNDIGEHCYQLISKANLIRNELRCNITGILIGDYSESKIHSVFQYGADEVLLCRQHDISLEQFIAVLKEMVTGRSIDLIMFPSTLWGCSSASALAVSLSAGLVADCIEIEECKKHGFIYSRAALNSSVLAKITCINSITELCTVKKNVFDSCSMPVHTKSDSIHEFKRKQKNEKKKIQIIHREINNLKQNDTLDRAKLIFGMGRGIKSSSNVRLLTQLADKYNGELAGTRAAVEEGFIQKSAQVGQSGISISPNIYVAFGISGASQHLVGLKNAKIIIAVNTDKNAPIFKYADYIVEEDCSIIMKQMLEIN